MELNQNNVPVVSAGISAGAGILGGIANIGSTLLANRANRKLAEYSYEQQRQMIREQNEYNSPKAQMARYMEAGLNPNLIYGDGSSMSGNQSSIAKYEAPRMEAPDVRLGINEALQMALAYRAQQADINLKEEQAYAQRMLGLGYEQDAYMKAVDNAVKSMNAGLKTPHGLWSADELEQIRQGNAVRRYTEETDMIAVDRKLKEANTALSHANARQKDWWTDNLGPSLVRLNDARKEGQDIANVVADIEKGAYEALSSIGGTGNASTLAKIFVDLLKVLSH